MDNTSVILVYGLARGETERYTEDLLATTCRTQSDVEKVITAAAKDGFHSFRTAIFTEGEKPNFARAVNSYPAHRQLAAAARTLEKMITDGDSTTVELNELRAALTAVDAAEKP
jgi:hypothetical protein